MRVELIDRQTGETTDITDCILPLETRTGDHYPFDANVHAAFMGAIAAALVNNPPPGSTLTPPPPKPATIVTRYGIDFCAICSLMVDYCRCGTTPAAEAANDGAESGLTRRVRECKGR